MAIDYTRYGGSDSEALRAFQRDQGRSPTAAEISAWRGSRGVSSPAKPATSPAAPAKDIVQQGFGGATQWETIQRYGLGPADLSTVPGLEMTPQADLGRSTPEVDSGFADMAASIERLSAANASMLKGEIPADVAASVRRAASESAISGGIFGDAARGLSARDLGRKSLDVKQQGIANESAISELRGSLAGARENVRQFNANRNAALAELSIRARQQNLTAIDVERQRIATNIEANLNIMHEIASLVTAQQGTAVQAAASKIDPGNIIASFDSMISQFTSRLY